MGIKASDDLFQLIQAMSPADKRAFRLLSERHARQDGNNYLALMEAISAQPEYDEALIRQQFPGKAFLKNLSEAKSYLYKSILRSMRFSRGPESPETELREILDHLELLHAKGLMDQAERQVKLGLDRAKKLDLHAFTAEFIRWQRRLIKWRGSKNLLQELESIARDEMLALQNLSKEAQLRDLMGRIQTIFAQQLDMLGAGKDAELKAIIAHPALQAPPVAAGFHALSAYFYAHAYYERSQSNTIGTMQAWEAVVQTFENHPVQIKRQPDQFFNALASLIDARLNIRQMQAVPVELERLRALKEKGKEPSSIARMFFLEQHLSFRFALVTGELALGLQRVPELEAGMVKYSKYLSASYEITFAYNLCSLYFLAERYPEAQRFINQAFNRPNLPIREDIMDALRILEMISRYTRGQTDVLEHLFRAQERRLRNRETRHPFSQRANKFIGDLLYAVDAAETKACLAKMREDLNEMRKASKPAGFDELQYWVHSRLESRRVEFVIRSFLAQE